MVKDDFLKRLNESFEGNPWFGSSFLQQVRGLTSEVAFYRPTLHNHNIAEILAHVLAWRMFVLEKLKLNKDYDLELGSSADWPPAKIGGIEDIILLIDQLQSSQKELVDLINTLGDKDLESQVPGKAYSFNYMLEGLLEHDVYHSGQIGLIKSIFKKVNVLSDKK